MREDTARGEATPILYKRDSKGKTRTWQAELFQIENDRYLWRTISGIEGGKLVRSGWKSVECKNIGKINETDQKSQAVSEMFASYELKAEGEYFKDRNDIDKYDKIKPMLASKHEDHKYDWSNGQYFSQPKLDGIRCIARKDGLWSRSGKLIVSIPHISDQLKPLFEKYPDAILDGELYNHDLRDNFNKITSLVRKTKPTESDLEETAELVQYHVYDNVDADLAFASRNFWLYCTVPHSKSVTVVTTVEVSDKDMLDTIYGRYLEDGFEGQMIRTNLPYEKSKRSKSLIKRKEFLTDEYKVVRVEEGNGNWSGHIKRFVLQTENGVEFGAGVRGNQATLSSMYQNKETPDWCTLRYFTPTPDGIPRFPVVIDWGNGKRED
tara:strand:- start:2177 stop:3316 length:1140 start_codon:yes stop_codon:yes gene_type:complete